jgi:hypothetical protein
VNARTLWIRNAASSNGSTFQLFGGATNSNFQHPLALTVLRPGLPLAAAPLVSPAPPSDQVRGAVPGILATP